MKLLLVEDDHADAQFLRACLARSQGFAPDLVHAECLNDAIAALGAASFDVVLLDLHLPDASGENCVRAITQVRPDVPIVVLWGEDSEEYALGILKEGVQDYLVKWDGEGKLILRAIRFSSTLPRSSVRSFPSAAGWRRRLSARASPGRTPGKDPDPLRSTYLRVTFCMPVSATISKASSGPTPSTPGSSSSSSPRPV